MVEVPAVSAAQMRQIDRLAEDEFHLSLLQMMENAGRALARLSRQRFLGGDLLDKRVLVLVGSGGNGGGGMAAARRLHTWGGSPSIFLATPAGKLTPVPALQLAALRKLGVPIIGTAARLPPSDLIIDALLGYSLQGPPREPFAGLIRLANHSGAPILSLDLPSGLDPDSGQPYDPCIAAQATLTLALPKHGLFSEQGKKIRGELWLADISIPAELYARMGIIVGSIFAHDDLIRLP